MNNNNEFKITEPKKKFSLSVLFNNDRFLMIFSFVISFCIWTAVSANSGEITNYPVSNVPVTMELSEDAENDGLSVVSINGVSVDDFKTTVKVKGNSVTVGSLKSSDIQVYGSNLGTIATSGTYNVALMARQLGVKNNYDIVSIDPSEVTVVVDRNITKELTIDTSQINASSPAEYYMGTPTLSEKTVVIRGPEQSVSKVVKAIVSVDIDSELTETTTLNSVEITLLDANDKEIEDESVVIEPITVDVTIPVLMKKTVPIVLEYENAPDVFDPTGFITLEPSEIEIAASSDILDYIDSVTVGTLNFNELAYGTSSMKFDIVMPEGVKNFNNIEEVTANFDFTLYSSKSFVISEFDFENIPDGLAAEYSSYRSILVRVVGPADAISGLKASEVSAVIDLTDAKSGTTDMPVTVKITKLTSCWIYGSYDVNVTVGDAATVSTVSSSQSAVSSKIVDTDLDNADSE